MAKLEQIQFIVSKGPNRERALKWGITWRPEADSQEGGWHVGRTEYQLLTLPLPPHSPFGGGHKSNSMCIFSLPNTHIPHWSYRYTHLVPRTLPLGLTSPNNNVDNLAHAAWNWLWIHGYQAKLVAFQYLSLFDKGLVQWRKIPWFGFREKWFRAAQTTGWQNFSFFQHKNYLTQFYSCHCPLNFASLSHLRSVTFWYMHISETVINLPWLESCFLHEKFLQLWIPWGAEIDLPAMLFIIHVTARKLC